ncbi:hypothetical protein F4804DRAFT_306347 [Jackrogersella minutella]|nr:hypothetical protein F4804DRAFT_306347 [Jackrogersella minutella]
MKFQISALLLSIAASAASAQSNQTGPFYLHITGKEGSSIDGYASSCHAGAAIEGLCYGAGAIPEGGSTSFEYYFNYSGYTAVDNAQVGQLSWKLPYTDGDGNPQSVPQVLGLQYLVNSNVAAPMFGFSSYSMNLGFDADGKLFGYSYYDDSTFTPGTNPVPSGDGTALYQWYACWQYFTGYYYQSVGWSVTAPPHNPTCEAVDITQVFPSS